MKIDSYNGNTILKITNGASYYYYHVPTSSIISFSSTLLLNLTPDLYYQLSCASFCVPVPPIDDEGCCAFAILSNSGACLLANNADCLEHNLGA